MLKYLAVDTIDAPATVDMIGAAGVAAANIFVRFVLVGVVSRVNLSVPVIFFMFFLGIRVFVILFTLAIPLADGMVQVVMHNIVVLRFVGGLVRQGF